VAVICTAAFWQLSTGADDSLHAPVLNPVDLAAQMRSSPFAQLSAVRQPDGEFLVRGRLATRAERRALDAWLVEHDVTARVDVIVDDVLARDVAEVFRVNGVNVRTTVAGPGQIQAVADEPDSARLADAATAVRRDVRSLVRLDVKNTAKPAPPPLPKVSADPNKRIVSVVPGSPGYLITADGARYFVGAMLPTGHRVARIGRASVTLELAGQTSRLEL
jgi:type III secretion protein D